MNEFIYNMYGFFVDNIDSYNDGYVFEYNGANYYLFKTDLKYEEVYNIFEAISLRPSKFHVFVLNRFKKVMSDDYVLFKVDNNKKTVSWEDVLEFSNENYDCFKKNVFMDELWENRINYYGSMLLQVNNNEFLAFFDYYGGIVEVLLNTYKNEVKNSEFKLALCHKSMRNLSVIDFYNPLNVCVDHFLKDRVAFILLTERFYYLSNVLNGISSFDRLYCFIRIVFPFEYYCNIFSILEGNEHYNISGELIKLKKYEQKVIFIMEIFGIFLFDWIKKE